MLRVPGRDGYSNLVILLVIIILILPLSPSDEERDGGEGFMAGRAGSNGD
jgi:hypothetical protein